MCFVLGQQKNANGCFGYLRSYQEGFSGHAEVQEVTTQTMWMV